MIVCKQCGFQNGDKDSFCGSCGAFLEWTGEKVAAPAPQPVEIPEEEKRKKSLYERVTGIMYADVGERDKVERPPGPGMPGMGGPGMPPGGPRPPGAPGGPPGAPGGPPGPPGGPPGPPGGPPRPPGAPPGPPGPPGAPPGPPGAPPGPPGAPPRPPGPPPGPPGGPPGPPGAPPRPPGPPPGPPGAPPAGPPPAAPPPGPPAAPPTGPPPAGPPPGPPTAPPMGPPPAGPPAAPPMGGPPTGPPVAPPMGPPPGGPPAAPPAAPPAPPPTLPPAAPPTLPSAAPPAAPPGAAGPTAPTAPQPPAARPAAPPPVRPPVAQPAQPTAEELAAASSMVAPIAQGGPALPPKDLPATAPVAAAAAAAAAQPTATQPGAVQPTAVKPGAAKKPPLVPKQAPSRKILPGDLICGDCGEGNSAQRKFCSRCGASLAAAVVAKEKWYRKFIPKRKQKTLAAGERTWKDESGNKKKSKMSAGRAAGKLRLVIGGLLLVAGMVYAAYSPFRDWVNTRYTTAKDRVMGVIRPQYVEVNAVPPALTNVPPELTLPDHDVGKLVDNFLNTTWIVPGAAVTGPPKPAATITFGQPIDLERLIVYNGDGEQFQSFHRAKILRLVFDNNKTDTIELKDIPEKQTVSVSNGSNISSVQIFVDDIYTAFQGNDLALSEIEFFRKK